MSGVLEEDKTEGNTADDHACLFGDIGFQYADSWSGDVFSVFRYIQGGNYTEYAEAYGTDRGEHGGLSGKHASDFGCGLL